jgi:hypothetical protein
MFEYIHHKTHNAKALIRGSYIVDGVIGLMLLVVVTISHKRQELLIYDMTNLLKVILASILYYFAISISINKEKKYYLYKIFGSLNMIFVTVSDYLINGRSFGVKEIILITILGFSGVFAMINDFEFASGLRRKLFTNNSYKKQIIN